MRAEEAHFLGIHLEMIDDFQTVQIDDDDHGGAALVGHEKLCPADRHPLATALQVLSWYALRWSIEVTFRDSKMHLGFEEPQGWTRKAVERTAPVAMVLFVTLPPAPEPLTPAPPPPLPAVICVVIVPSASLLATPVTELTLPPRPATARRDSVPDRGRNRQPADHCRHQPQPEP